MEIQQYPCKAEKSKCDTYIFYSKFNFWQTKFAFCQKSFKIETRTSAKETEVLQRRP